MLSIQSGTTVSEDYNGCLAHFFFLIYLLGRVWQPGADYNDYLAQFKIEKVR
jgi:hypothetical protein